jgi:hypothetical protein
VADVKSITSDPRANTELDAMMRPLCAQLPGRTVCVDKCAFARQHNKTQFQKQRKKTSKRQIQNCLQNVDS